MAVWERKEKKYNKKTHCSDNEIVSDNVSDWNEIDRDNDSQNTTLREIKS
jgi:hypothetical protein